MLFLDMLGINCINVIMYAGGLQPQHNHNGLLKKLRVDPGFLCVDPGFLCVDPGFLCVDRKASCRERVSSPV